MKIKFFVITAVLVTVLGFGVGANAQTADTQALIAQLQAQIQALMQQIAALIAQQNGTQTWCHTFNTNLGYANSASTEVGYLHTVLDKQGISYAGDTGNTYSDGTAAAIVEFQKNYASEVLTPYNLRRGTGYVGPSTRKKINALYGCNTVPTPTPQPTCQNLWWLDNTNTSCQSEKQFCGTYMYQGLQTFINKQDCLNAVALIQSKQPYISIISPNGGETWTEGQNYTITWSGSNLPANSTVTIMSYSVFYNSYRVIASGISSSQTSYSWKAEATKSYIGFQWKSLIDKIAGFFLPTAKAAAGVGMHKIKIEVKDANGAKIAEDFSNEAFLIQSQTAKSVKITSPNGGETWKVGETHNITWTQAGLASSNVIYINVYNNSNSSRLYEVARLVPVNQGSYSWTIPANIFGTGLSFATGSGYNIRIQTQVYDGGYYDDITDASFTIAATTTSCTGYADNAVVLNSMQLGNGTVSFNLTNTTASAQTVLVSIGSGSVNPIVLTVPAGTCSSPKIVTYTAPSSTTITFTNSGQTIASFPVSATTTSCTGYADNAVVLNL